MNALLLLVAQNGLLLLAGTTLLLSLGCGAVLLCKSPVHRQRISELTIAGVLVWMVLALFPFPRLLPESWNAKPPAAEAAIPVMLEAERRVEVFIPIETEWIPETSSYDGNEHSHLPVEPSFVPSPSEEIAILPPQIQPPTSTRDSTSEVTTPAWQFDFHKLAGLATGLYLAGASLGLFWILAGYVLLLRIRQTATAPPTWLANQYQTLARQAGIAPPRLIVSRLCGRPLTWGMFWPVIVLPQSLCRQENKSQLTTILLHELGHIAQQDAQGNFLFCLALPLLYAHPLYWWLRRESQLAAELVADDWAAWQTGKETYVEELVALARCTGTSSLPLVGVTGLFSSPSQFYRRMQMLLAREKPLCTKTSLPWRLASLSALAGSVALAASLAGVRPVAGQTETPAVAPPAAAPADVKNEPAPRTSSAEPELRARVIPPAGATKDDVLNPPLATPALGERLEAVSPAEAALLTEIKELQAKLQVLMQKRITGTKPIEDSKIAASEPLIGQIKIIRWDDQGFAVETWTTDKQGRPEKMLGKQIVSGYEALTGTIPAAVAIDVSGNGKTLTRELVTSDGARITQVVEIATGKVIAENRRGSSNRPKNTTAHNEADPIGTKPGQPITLPGPPRVEFPIPTVKGETRVPFVPFSRQQPYSAKDATVTTYGPADPNLTKGRQQIDLISLATSYADAVSECEAAAARVQDIDKMGGAKAISQQEVTTAKLALSAAERKEKLLRSIAQVALESAAEEVDMAKKMVEAGRVPVSAVAEAGGRLEILKQILGTREPAVNPLKKP